MNETAQRSSAAQNEYTTAAAAAPSRGRPYYKFYGFITSGRLLMNIALFLTTPKQQSST
jgi:hypothetical protein